MLGTRGVVWGVPMSTEFQLWVPGTIVMLALILVGVKPSG